MLRPIRTRHTRRQFLERTLALGAGAATWLADRQALARQAIGDDAPRAPAAPKTLLILGGTNFTGPHIVAAARERGHQVTIFTRGKTNPDLFTDLEKLVGDRDPLIGNGLKPLEGRKWDAVIDTSGHVPRHMKASSELLRSNVGHYVFVSSLSAYADHDTPGADETAPLAQLTQETEDFNGDAFGPLKALCEKTVQAAMPDRCAIVRPGLIVGPRDRSDRFTYWVARLERGGEVLAPNSPDDPIMLIDARDLAEWLITLVEHKTAGVFNAIGPDHGLSIGEMLEACREASGSDATFTWVSSEFLEQNDVHAWTDLPVWFPPTPPMSGFHKRSIARALAAGIKFRPIEVTCKDTLAWFKSLPAERQKTLRKGLSPEREKALLDQWHARASK